MAVENVLRRTTKLIPELRDKTSSERLQRLDFPSLKFRRLRGDLIQTFKIFSEIDDIKPTDIFTLPTHTGTRHSLYKIFKSQARTNKRQTSYTIRVANFWNNLTDNTKLAKDTNNFKNLLTKEFNINKLKYCFD